MVRMVSSMNPDQARTAFVKDYLEGLKRCIDVLSIDSIAELIRLLDEAYQRGRQVFIIGNGGSAATASHMASDLSKTILPKNASDSVKRFRVMALTDNVPWLTALANDLSYQQIFAEQLKTWVDPGDLVIAISGSGNSPSILEGIRVAKSKGATVVGMLGFEGGAARAIVDHMVLVRSDSFGFIEDLHVALNHLVTAFLSQHVTAMVASEPTPARILASVAAGGGGRVRP